LVATGATSVVVTGNNGLNLTNTGNVAITTFDASGIVGDAAEDTAALLGVTFASANTTATATVAITGGAGNDVLTGNAAKDIIIGGAGADNINGGVGIDNLTGGAGQDIFTVTATQAGITGQEKITDFMIGLTGDTLATGVTTLVGNQTDTDVTAAVGGAVNVTATVVNGLITIGGADAALVDTIGEFKAIFELIDTAATADTAAFVFGGNTYVVTDNAADVTQDIVQLAGVTNATSLSAAFADGAINIA
jgi:S-layer protein